MHARMHYVCSTVFRSTSLRCQRTAKESSENAVNSPIAHTTPTRNIPETTELYNVQNFGSQWCPLLRDSTVLWSHLMYYYGICNTTKLNYR